MGDATDDILKSFKLSEDKAKKYTIVKARFDQHFVKKHNVIYDRVKFNRRVQGTFTALLNTAIMVPFTMN